MKKWVFLTLLFTAFLLNANAQVIDDAPDYSSVDKIFGAKREIIFTFHVNDKDQINNDLTKIISIDKVTASQNGGFEVRAYANKKEFAEFLTRGIAWELVVNKSTKAYNMATTTAQMATWDRYPTYSVYEQMMLAFQTTYPTRCNLDTIMAATPDGHRILVLKISDNVTSTENEPRFFFSSSIHGDETTGFILMLRMANYLLTNYGSIAKVTNLVNNMEIWICPLANPDGTYASGDNTIDATSATRSNSNGVDMNRNYADPRDGDHPDGNPWQPETQAFMAFAGAHHFNMGANFHGGAEVMNYPWDTWITSGNPNADDAWWDWVCTAYVDTTRLITPTYMTDVVSSGVTEGGDWYIITGGRQDYMNYFQYTKEVTIELDGTKTTETQNLPGMWNTNYRSLLNLMQQSLYGLRGVITDSCTGLPIKAKVWISSYDQANDSSQVYSFLPVGDYHKYLSPGTYSVTYSAPGYANKTVNNVVISNNNTTTVNVSFAPSLPNAEFAGDVTNTCTGVVNFTDLSTGGANTWTWNFGDGYGSSTANPVHAYASSGTYTVSLVVSNCKGNNTETKTSYITVSLPTAPTVTNGTHCGPGSVSLSANGTGTLNWYDAAIGGSIVNTGNSYAPSLTSTTTYYVQSDVAPPAVAGGKLDNTGGGGNLTNQNQYEIFDCYAACTIVSVEVYASVTGNRTFELRNSSGTVLQSATVNITSNSGAFTVPLGFSVPVGTNLQLGLASTSTCNLYRNNAGVTYPYTTAGVLSVTTSSASPNPGLYYYYLYNWQIQEGSCSSARIPVTATIDALVNASFTQSIAAGSVTFTNTSTNASSYYWDFGDGQTSTQASPFHIYSADGSYPVMMVATNTCGSDTAWYTAVISTVGSVSNADIASQISIYPNPAKDNIYLTNEGTVEQDCMYEIINMVGESVLKGQVYFTPGNGSATVNVAILKQGIYFIKLIMNDSSVTRKIIIDN